LAGPSWPCEFIPQHHKEPSPRVPQACSAPRDTLVQSDHVPTCTGETLSSVSPVPSWAFELSPQHHRVPSLATAQVVAFRTARLFQPATKVTVPDWDSTNLPRVADTLFCSARVEARVNQTTPDASVVLVLEA